MVEDNGEEGMERMLSSWDGSMCKSQIARSCDRSTEARRMQSGHDIRVLDKVIT